MYFAGELREKCREQYDTAIEGLKTKEDFDSWVRALEIELAETHDLDAQADAARRVVELQDEINSLVRPITPNFIISCVLTPY
jgi:hypothetical protein